MKSLKKGLLGVLYVMTGYAVFAALLALTPNSVPATDPTTKQQPTIEVLLLPGPIHYDFLIPMTDQTRRSFGWTAQHGVLLDHPSVRWLVVGYGGAEFYTTVGTYRDVQLGTLWRSLTGDTAVIRLDVAGELPANLVTRPVPMTADQFTAFLQALADSFAGERPAPLDYPGHSLTDLFFVATGRFHALRTCNVWVGQMLGQSGIRFGRWTPTPYAVRLAHWMYVGR